MSANVEQVLLLKLRSLSARQLAEVEDFVDFLTAKARRQAAKERLLTVAPALEAAGLPAMTEDEVQAEIQASRAERSARAASNNMDPKADHS